MKWERIFVEAAGRVVLVVYFDLKVFLPWLLKQQGWDKLFHIPNRLLVIAVDPDGFPTFRWAQDKNNGFFNIAIKIVHNKHLNDSMHLVIPESIDFKVLEIFEWSFL